MVKFSVLHPVFKLFLSGIAEESQSAYLQNQQSLPFSFGWSDDVLMS